MSITTVLLSAVRFFPICLILLFSIRISAPSRISLPFIVMILAFFKSIVPSGVSRLAFTSILVSVGLYSFGLSSFLSVSSFSSFFSSSPASFLAFFSASRASLKAFSASKSHTPWALPTAQCTFLASQLQAGNWPPISVNCLEGKAALSGLATLMLGASSLTCGTVTTNKSFSTSTKA